MTPKSTEAWAICAADGYIYTGSIRFSEKECKDFWANKCPDTMPHTCIQVDIVPREVE